MLFRPMRGVCASYDGMLKLAIPVIARTAAGSVTGDGPHTARRRLIGFVLTSLSGTRVNLRSCAPIDGGFPSLTIMCNLGTGMCV